MIKRLIASLQQRKKTISDKLSFNNGLNYGYIALCCIIKDENDYLQEWINYHLKIGVEHFYIYDNGSQIPISLTLEKNQLLKYATVIRMPGKARQAKAYTHCLKHFGRAYNWIGFIDTDEFIVPKCTKGDLKTFMKEFEPYGGLAINWMMFGSSGHLKKTCAPQLESFQLRAEESFSINRHIKSIVQPKYVAAVLGAHNFDYTDGKYCVNENFAPVNGPFSDTSVDKIQLNHYYCRSLEEYELKIKRGYGDTRKKRTISEFYRHDADSNKIKDTTILELLDLFNNDNF